jgi:hypothetical protein
MINQSVEQSIGSPGGLYLPSTDDVQAALAFLTEAWEKLTPAGVTQRVTPSSRTATVTMIVTVAV